MFKKCLNCKEVVHVLKGKSNLVCCGKDMIELLPNSVDASFEKHVPEFEIKDNKIYVKINHVMDPDHYIEWIAIENENEFYMKKLNPGDIAEATFNYIPNATIYSYCNLHSLWEKEM